MSTLSWIILVGLFLVIAVTLPLLLRLRLRAQWGTKRRLVFVGLGRSGPEVDLAKKMGAFKMFGITLKRFSLKSEPEKEDETKKKPKAKKARKPRRQRSWSQVRELVPVVARESGSFLKRILSAVVIEELQGEVRAGFDSPSDTGTAYGYYQAAVAAAPSVVGRVRFEPVWEGASFAGSAKVAVALPLYKLVWRIIVLALRLPLREIYKLAIGTRKGGHDVQ